MKRKICFFDIDGTLTKEGRAAEALIPESCRHALELAHDQGVLLFVNTGRPTSTINQKIKDLPLDGMVCSCGSAIYMNDEKLYYYQLDETRQREIVKRVAALPVACTFEGEMGQVATNLEYHDGIRRSMEIYRKEGYPEYSADDEEYRFEKFCLFKSSDQSWPDLSFLEEFEMIPRSPDFYEVVPNCCSKGKAIHFLLDQLNISEEDCYVFGDSENDWAMLETVSNSIVMGHAPEKLKEKAKWVAPKPSEDGIYRIMLQLGLIHE